MRPGPPFVLPVAATAHRLAQVIHDRGHVALRRLQAGMAERGLDVSHVRPALQHVPGAGVPEGVRR